MALWVEPTDPPVLYDGVDWDDEPDPRLERFLDGAARFVIVLVGVCAVTAVTVEVLRRLGYMS